MDVKLKISNTSLIVLIYGLITKLLLLDRKQPVKLNSVFQNQIYLFI